MGAQGHRINKFTNRHGQVSKSHNDDITTLKQRVCVCVSDLLGIALLGLDLVVLLRRHPGDARRARPWQRLHLLDGFYGDALGEHLEERRHIHDDTLLVRVRHRHICRSREVKLHG